MAKEFFATKVLGSLVPTTEDGEDYLRTIPEKTVVRVKVTDPRARNLKQHNLLFALLAQVADLAVRPMTTEGVLFALKVLLGHADWVYVGGQMHPHPKSISFANMEQVEFERFFDDAIRLALNEYLPKNTDVEAFRQSVQERAEIYYGVRR